MAESGQAPGAWRHGDGVRTFNTAGPCDPKRHYMLPPEPRVPGALYLVDLDEYFVIHAPRQTGKTTVLDALARDINVTGERLALVPFPASVVLCGMQNIRDYKAASGGNPETLVSSSPFTIIVDSLRIADFTREQVAELYAQHTAEAGQEFEPAAIDRVFEYTQGQPWLLGDPLLSCGPEKWLQGRGIAQCRHGSVVHAGLDGAEDVAGLAGLRGREF
jgi:hypothetical protein